MRRANEGEMPKCFTTSSRHRGSDKKFKRAARLKQGIHITYFLFRSKYINNARERYQHTDGGNELPKKSVEAILRGESRITSRGQITIPMEIRRKFGLNPGDVICFLEINGSIVLKLGPLVLTE